MRRVLWVIPVVALGLIATGWMLGTSTAQDDAPPIRVQLPNGWTRIGLDDLQKEKIYEVRRNYRKQIRDLEAQINELRKKERAEMIKLLTSEQKDALVEVLLGGSLDRGKDDSPKDGSSKDRPAKDSP